MDSAQNVGQKVDGCLIIQLPVDIVNAMSLLMFLLEESVKHVIKLSLAVHVANKQIRSMEINLKY